MIYAPTLEALRALEEDIQRDIQDQIRPEGRSKTLNDLFEQWRRLKRGLKDNTFQNYLYLYNAYVAPSFGRRRITSLVKSDVKRFYNTLADERGLRSNTIDNVHTVLHQVLEMAVEDHYIRNNPSDNALRELKQAQASQEEKRRSLTLPGQELFLQHLKKTPQYRHWYPIFAVMIGTGMRVGEMIGLRWCDIDLEAKIIDVNHTLVYCRHVICTQNSGHIKF